MTKTDILNPHPPEFERFLYAAVGEDRNGLVVTVLSTLARLGLDPWSETADLVTLGRDAARLRLELLLSKFRDVPALGKDHGKVAHELSLLLPKGPPQSSLTHSVTTAAKGHSSSSFALWTMVAIFVLVAQVLVTWVLGAGE